MRDSRIEFRVEPELKASFEAAAKATHKAADCATTEPGYPSQRDIDSAFTLMGCIILGGVLLAVALFLRWALN